MSFVRAPRNPMWASAFVIVAVLFQTEQAQAQDSAERTSSLSWVRLEGAEACIGTQELAQAVEDRLARKVFVSASEADVSVEGHVERARGKWHAVITIRDSNGELLGTRELDSAEKECSALSDPLVFVVSVLIDPEAESPVEKPKEAQPPPVPPPAPPARVIVRKERVLVPVAPKKDPWRLEAGAGVAVGAGLLPGTSLGLSTTIIVEPPSFWGILIGGTYWFQRSVRAEQNASSDSSLAYASVGLCPARFGADRVSYRLCAGLSLGSLRSRGVEFDLVENDEKLAAYVTVPNRLGVRIAGPLAATAGVTLLVPLVRTELTYRDAAGVSHTLFDPSPIAVSGDLGSRSIFSLK